MKSIASCIRDAGPDAWGRRLINYRFPDLNANELDYLLRSGSNRIGALDFQESATDYIPRISSTIHLDEIERFALVAENAVVIDNELALLLLNVTSIGGARPKCFVEHNGKDCIAKFSLSSDYYPIIKGEYIAMKLAKKAGLSVAELSY